MHPADDTSLHAQYRYGTGTTDFVPLYLRPYGNNHCDAMRCPFRHSDAK